MLNGGRGETIANRRSNVFGPTTNSLSRPPDILCFLAPNLRYPAGFKKFIVRRGARLRMIHSQHTVLGWKPTHSDVPRQLSSDSLVRHRERPSPGTTGGLQAHLLVVS